MASTAHGDVTNVFADAMSQLEVVTKHVRSPAGPHSVEGLLVQHQLTESQLRSKGACDAANQIARGVIGILEDFNEATADWDLEKYKLNVPCVSLLPASCRPANPDNLCSQSQRAPVVLPSLSQRRPRHLGNMSRRSTQAPGPLLQPFRQAKRTS